MIRFKSLQELIEKLCSCLILYPFPVQSQTPRCQPRALSLSPSHFLKAGEGGMNIRLSELTSVFTAEHHFFLDLMSQPREIFHFAVDLSLLDCSIYASPLLCGLN